MLSARKIFFFISALLFILFVYFSYLVAKERFVQLDFDTTVKLQDHIPSKWDLPFSLLSLLGSAEVTGLVWLLFLVFALLKRYWLTVLTLSLFLVSVIIEIFGKLFVLHPGPPFLFYKGVLSFNFPSHYVHTSYSYPSGHMTRISFLIAFLLVFFQLKTSFFNRILLQVMLLIFLGLMVISRIYLGEHWTTDVVGGTLLGSSLGIFTALTIPNRKNV